MKEKKDGPKCKICDRTLLFKEEFRDRKCDLCKFQDGELE